MPSRGHATAARLPGQTPPLRARGTAVVSGGRPIPPNAGDWPTAGRDPRSTTRRAAMRPAGGQGACHGRDQASTIRYRGLPAQSSGSRPLPAPAERSSEQRPERPVAQEFPVRIAGDGGFRQGASAGASSVPTTGAAACGETLQDIVRTLMRTVLEDFPDTLDGETIERLETTKNPWTQDRQPRADPESRGRNASQRSQQVLDAAFRQTLARFIRGGARM